MKSLLASLTGGYKPTTDELVTLLNCCSEDARQLRECAAKVACERFGRAVYLRGLIEISSYCRRDCYYCGLRASNRLAERYRLTEEQILECCEVGYSIGLRTFVLQGGEDNYWSDERLVPLVAIIRSQYPDAAITLSLGERSDESYRALRAAGATRYLLRHEAANSSLYATLHPHTMSHSSRLHALTTLLSEGYQTGMGMMIGVPNQSIECIAEDIELMARFGAQMVGIGPFIPHPDTPFASHAAGNIELTLNAIAVTRLLMPSALIPATTALATLCRGDHSRAILSGANVVMPNLSPASVRSKYAIYKDKTSSGSEAVEGIETLRAELESVGYTINFNRGDYNDTI